MVPKDLKYTLTHEWVRLKGRIAVIGLTEFALEDLGRVINLELPNEGDEVLSGMTFGDVETMRALHEVTSPLEGDVAEVNTTLYKDLDLLNKDPYRRGWLIKVRVPGPQKLDSLLSPEDYEAQVKKR